VAVIESITEWPGVVSVTEEKHWTHATRMRIRFRREIVLSRSWDK
jgi:hypothetical protein